MRYLDLATTYISLYNSLVKVFFILGSVSAVLVVYVILKEDSESKYDTFRYLPFTYSVQKQYQIFILLDISVFATVFY